MWTSILLGGASHGLGSVCFGPKYKVKIRRCSEGSEVTVSRQKQNALVDTALGNQGIPETRLVTPCQHLCPQQPCTLPIAWFDLNQRHFRQRFGNA